MFLRASALAIGATESSRSRNTWSESSPWAFSRKRGFEPGTAWQDRRARSARGRGPGRVPGPGPGLASGLGPGPEPGPGPGPASGLGPGSGPGPDGEDTG